jgi:hypothetical protein
VDGKWLSSFDPFGKKEKEHDKEVKERLRALGVDQEGARFDLKHPFMDDREYFLTRSNGRTTHFQIRYMSE